MPLYLKSKKLDFSTGQQPTVVINKKEAEDFGILPGDLVEMTWSKGKKIIATSQFTESKVKGGYIGLFKEVWSGRDFIADEDIVEISIVSRPASVQAIQKKIKGEHLSYEEIHSIIEDIVEGRLGKVEMTYFIAASFAHEDTDDEIFYLSKSIAETGEMMDLDIEVVDKHSVGGLPGNRTTMLVIPIIASLGLYIPKTSSRAITSPAGTADTMEVLAPVSFPMKKIKEIIKKTKACLVWGGGLKLAPADDILIKVSRPLGTEPFDKMIVSIMAKKVAMGVDYLLIDLPVGPTAKVKNMNEAKEIEKRFLDLGKRFNMKVRVVTTKAIEPIGRGIGPALEARGVLRVLQRHKLRPLDLEEKSVLLAGQLLELKGFCKIGEGQKIAQGQIDNGEALNKMREIIKAQGGDEKIDSEEVISGALRYEIHAKKDGKITLINNKSINEVCMNLGAPREKVAGLHFHVRHGQKVKKGDKLFTLYAPSEERMELGKTAIEKLEVVEIS